MRFACLYMPDFVLQANLRNEPGAPGQAIALVEGAFPRVVAATRAACEAGVALGQTRAQAAQLASVRHRSAAQEDSAHAALLDGARSCSPRVEDTAADAVVADLEGLEKLLGPPSRIAARLLGQAEELGLRIRVAIAANPDTTILAARGFDGVTIIPPGDEAQKLGELPVSVLDPQPETLDTLHRWGINFLKELAELPPLSLSERLGQEGVRLQELARGKHSRSLVISRDAERFEEGWELEHPAATLDELDFVLSSVLVRLSKRLAMRSLAAEALRLRLELVGGVEPEPSLALEEQKRQRQEARDERQVTRDERRETRNKQAAGDRGDPAALPALHSSLVTHHSSLVSCLSSLSLRFPLPINNAQLFFKLWRLRLESDLPRAPVAKITITAQPARPRALQGGLFAPLAPDPEKLELTLARIAAVVGSGNVGSPELPDTHRPHAFRMAAFNPAADPKISIHRTHRIERPDGSDESRRDVMLSPSASLRVNSAKHLLVDRGEKQILRSAQNDKVRDSRQKSKLSQPCSIPRGVCATRTMQAPSNLKFEIQNLKPEIQNLKSLSAMALRLFRPPLPARVDLSSGRPVRLSSSGVRGRVVFAAGPWRKSGGWWEEEQWDREEWDVEIRTGKTAALYAIYRDLDRSEWFVQGEYD